MALGSLYKKYGGNSDPGLALIEGQRLVGESFKEALAGVDKLLATTEQKYIDQNTLNMQEYLKNNIKAGGLGSEDPDMIGIKQKFGSLINTEQLDKTVAETKGKMMDDARGQASVVASQAFDADGDIVNAGNIFDAELAKAGLKPQLREAEKVKWREFNKYKVEDNKIVDDLVVPQVIGQTLDQAEAEGNVGYDVREIFKNNIKDLLPRQQRRATEEFETALQKRGLMDDQTKQAHRQLEMMADDQAAATLMQDDLNVKKWQTAYSQAPGIPIAASDGSKKLASELAGAANAFSKEFKGDWWSVGSNDLSEGALIKTLRGLDTELANAGVTDPDDRSAILFQSMNGSINGGEGEDKGINLSSLTNMVGQNLNNFKTQRQIAGELQKAEEIKQRNQQDLKQRKTKMLGDLEKSSFANKIYGKGHDPEAIYKQAGFTIPGAAQDGTAQPGTGQKREPGKPFVLGAHNIADWATDPEHETKVALTYERLPDTPNAESLNAHIKSKFKDSPVTGEMIMASAEKYNVDPRVMTAIMQVDSGLGTAGKGKRLMNPGNVGNDDAGNEKGFNTWEEGVDAVAKLLATDRYQNKSGSTQTSASTAPAKDEIKKKAAEMAQPAPAENAPAAGATNIKEAAKVPDANENSRGRTEPGGQVVTDIANAFSNKLKNGMKPSQSTIDNNVARLANRIGSLPADEQPKALAEWIKRDPTLGVALVMALKQLKDKKA